MTIYKTTIVVALILVGSLGYSQQLGSDLNYLKENTCLIDFKARTINLDLEEFVKCYEVKLPVNAAQSNLQVQDVNFKKLPLLVPNHEFPTMQNSYRESFLRIGEYENSFANARTNNLAFFEANRNSVMGTGFSISTPQPTF